MPRAKPKSVLPSLKEIEAAQRAADDLAKGKLPKSVLVGVPVKPMLPKRTSPVWKGPEVDGVTYSLLCRFLSCRERFRILVVEGLKAAETFYAPIEFGNMWHACEEAHAANQPYTPALRSYCQELCRRFPMDRQQISDWMAKCEALYPIYVDYWAKHPDVTGRIPLLQEQTFCVDYPLPSGRVVKLRGKWDSVDVIDESGKPAVYVQENKSKSSVDGSKIHRRVGYDLQTMIYLVALYSMANQSVKTVPTWAIPLTPKPVRKNIKGVRYNVIRRPAHKTVQSMLAKIAEDREDNRMDEWFARWKITVLPDDIQRFKNECLTPILEHLCDWWQQITGAGSPVSGGYRIQLHWRHPFGVANSIDEGYATDLDEYLATGSTVGLQRIETLFPELEEPK